MKVETEITIERSIADVWHALATQFTDAQSWMSPVRRSYALSGKLVANAPVAGRTCELSDKGADGLIAHETITLFDAQNQRLAIEIVPANTPPGFPVRKNVAIYQLTALGSNRTHLSFNSEVETNTLGTVISPLLKV